jgi:hypothetical protein
MPLMPISIPVPAGPGFGTKVDVSTMGTARSIFVRGAFRGQVLLLGSDTNNDDDFVEIARFESPYVLDLENAAPWLRVQRLTPTSGSLAVQLVAEPIASGGGGGPCNQGTPAPDSQSWPVHIVGAPVLAANAATENTLAAVKADLDATLTAIGSGNSATVAAINATVAAINNETSATVAAIKDDTSATVAALMAYLVSRNESSLGFLAQPLPRAVLASSPSAWAHDKLAPPGGR